MKARFRCPWCNKVFRAETRKSVLQELIRCPKCSMSVSEEDFLLHRRLLIRTIKGISHILSWGPVKVINGMKWTIKIPKRILTKLSSSILPKRWVINNIKKRLDEVEDRIQQQEKNREVNYLTKETIENLIPGNRIVTSLSLSRERNKLFKCEVIRHDIFVDTVDINNTIRLGFFCNRYGKEGNNYLTDCTLVDGYDVVILKDINGEILSPEGEDIKRKFSDGILTIQSCEYIMNRLPLIDVLQGKAQIAGTVIPGGRNFEIYVYSSALNNENRGTIRISIGAVVLRCGL